jgi:excisionase family DNA binding protein
MRPDLHALPQPPTPEELCSEGAMTIPRAVEFTGIGRTTLYRLVREGRLHRSKVDGRSLLLRRELVALLTDGLEGIEEP